MIKALKIEDCGNSPRKKFLYFFYLDLIQNNTDAIQKHISENIFWFFNGHLTANGTNDFFSRLKVHPIFNVKDLNIDSIITHGALASVNGHFTTQNQVNYTFCDVFQFKSAGKSTIQQIKSYLIEI